MSSRYIPERLRALVRDRAGGACEYCLIHEEDAFFSLEIDHIISLKHHGKTEEDNLAYACIFCNRNKGSDVATFLFESNQVVRLFHPRTDRWSDHFALRGEEIVPLTEIGQATVKILMLNHPDQLLERKALIDIGRYPPP